MRTSIDMQDPDIAFFAQANPKHTEGHGLLTFIPLRVRQLGILLGRYWKRLTGVESRQKPVGAGKSSPSLFRVKNG